MSTSQETVDYILDKLKHTPRFSARKMFGEYALYADGKTVALVCDDLLYVKICPASAALESTCEKDSPYPGAKPHYIVSEEQLDSIATLPNILFGIATSLPAKRPNKK